MIKSIIYRENFMKALESAKNMDNYDLLIKRLERYTNPINFYNFIQKSSVFSNLFLYYKPGSGVKIGNFDSDQERFNYGLEQLRNFKRIGVKMNM